MERGASLPLHMLSPSSVCHLYSLREIIPRLQSALRQHFPRTVEGSELVIDPSSPPAPQPVWQLIAADGSRGVYVSTRSLSLHATAYVNFPDFIERWSGVLAAICETDFNPFVERAGLRYIDMIVPGDSRQPKDYLIQQLRGVHPIEDAIIQSSIWGATFSVDGFVLKRTLPRRRRKRCYLRQISILCSCRCRRSCATRSKECR